LAREAVPLKILRKMVGAKERKRGLGMRRQDPWEMDEEQRKDLQS
jgi:hypothetical protein